MDKMYALCGTAFFITFALVAVITGQTAPIVLLFLFSAGASQFLAQASTKTSYIMANVFIGLALLAAIVIMYMEVVYAMVTP